MAGPSTGQLDLDVLCIQHQTLNRLSSVIRGPRHKRGETYGRAAVDDCTDRRAVAFAVGRDSEESAKGRHRESKREMMVVEMKREEERTRSGSYTNISLTQRIYEEKRASRVDHRLGENSSKCLHNPLWVFTPPPPPRRYLRSHYKTHRRRRGESPKMTTPLTSALPVPNAQETR